MDRGDTEFGVSELRQPEIFLEVYASNSQTWIMRVSA